MFHIRKNMTKAEKEQYRLWQAKHRSEIRSEILNPTRAQRDASAAEFWAKQAQEQATVMRGTPTQDEVKRPESYPEKRVFGPLCWVERTEEQQIEWEDREAAAKVEAEAKKLRTAPVYNKGGNQYWTEGMLADLKSGAHRRRP